LQVAAHVTLQRIAVEADDLAEQLRGQHRLAVLFLLGDDLQQHLAGEVVAGLGVAHLEVLAVDDQLSHVLDRDVAGDLGVVEATVRIFLDDAYGHAQNPRDRPRAWRSAARVASRRGWPRRGGRYQPMYWPPF